MRTNDSVRAMIIDNNELLLIKRIKKDITYYVFPGGGVEEGETFLEALNREVLEEINIRIKYPEKLYQENSETSTNHFYLCEYASGEFGISNGPEYTSLEYQDKGQYIPVRIPIDQLANYNIVPHIVRDLLIKDLNNKSFNSITFDNKKRI